MKLLHVSRDALALGLGAALVADCFVPDLDLMGGRDPDDRFYPPVASTRFALQAPSGATPSTLGGLQLDRVPLPSPTPQQRRDAS